MRCRDSPEKETIFFLAGLFVILFWKVRKRIPTATRVTENIEERTWCAKATFITNTSSPTDTVPLNAAAKEWFVGTY